MGVERGDDRVWRQNNDRLYPSPEDQMIAAEGKKEREDFIAQVVDEINATTGEEIKGDESGEKTLEGKSE